MNFTRTVLPNNSRLITAPRTDTQTASLFVMVKVGSRQETARLNGAAHFVEHLMFKGTKKRPNVLALSKELDGVGAEYNAFTGKDYTGYYVKTDARHLDMAIDVLSDMLLNSKFDATEIEREKGVIVEEINMYEDNPSMHVDDLLEEQMFAGSTLGRNIAGTRETVRGLTRADLAGYHARHYRGANIVIGVGGAFEDRHVKAIERSFRFPKSTTQSNITKFTQTQRQPRIAVQFKETEQSQLALGLPAYRFDHPRRYALRLLSVILGGNMSSRLFVRVRERHGLAYSVRSSVGSYEDTGSLVIQAGLDKLRIDQALKLIVAELEKMKLGVTRDELSRAKEFIAGSMALNLEDSASLIQWYINQELFNQKIKTPDDVVKKMMAVTNDDIKRVASELIRRDRLSLAVIGPYEDSARFKKGIQ